MFISFSVENFRCFRKLEIAPLSRINLIAGKNNAGKTALLEALFLHYGYHNPTLGIVVDAMRGIQRFKSDELMLNLFWNFDSSREIRLTSQTDDGHTLVLKILSRVPQQSFTALTSRHPTNGGGKVEIFDTHQESTKVSNIEVQFIYQEDDSEPGITTATLTESSDEVRFDRKLQSNRPPAILHAAKHRENNQQIAERFSNLAVAREEKTIISILNLIEPKLKGLTLQHRGGDVMIYGDTGESRLIPLQLMGDGIGRVLNHVLAIPQVRGGAFLVDEIENGLHYAIMTDFWRALGEIAKTYDVQLFATTHSSECINAAREAFQQNPDDFRLHRLERIEDEIQVKSYDFDTLSMALELGLETR